MADREIKDLRNSMTKGERLWLWRQTRGLSQAEAAAKLGLTPKQYWKAEADLKEYHLAESLPKRKCRYPKDCNAPDCPCLGNGKSPDLGLLCRLARRRHGEGLHGTARLLGISHMTLLQRESGADPALVAAWKGLGYRF